MAGETQLQQTIRLALGRMDGVKLFRNNVGMAETSDGGFIKYGLCNGSSDLIGWVSTEITPEMVGSKIAVFAAIEVKSKSGRVSDAQAAFIDRVKLDGGIAGFARSVDDAKAIICR